MSDNLTIHYAPSADQVREIARAAIEAYQIDTGHFGMESRAVDKVVARFSYPKGCRTLDDGDLEAFARAYLTAMCENADPFELGRLASSLADNDLKGFRAALLRALLGEG